VPGVLGQVREDLDEDRVPGSRGRRCEDGALDRVWRRFGRLDREPAEEPLHRGERAADERERQGDAEQPRSSAGSLRQDRI
jgi:hypothetical protein